MSDLENFIWYLVGYGTMPVIFAFGFAATATAACFLLELMGKE
ncbi:MAG: TIGR02808 family protein [Halieaceae bacterium]|jgi:uncharacterized protein (TIGR02808 family)|nr:TIGR02808 family protein [Halieaceae bacterium]